VSKTERHKSATEKSLKWAAKLISHAHFFVVEIMWTHQHNIQTGSAQVGSGWPFRLKVELSGQVSLTFQVDDNHHWSNWCQKTLQVCQTLENEKKSQSTTENVRDPSKKKDTQQTPLQHTICNNTLPEFT
jgi:hypothetical protein